MPDLALLVNLPQLAVKDSTQLSLLGHTVAESTVTKYMVGHRRTDPDQSWKTLLQNHLAETAACDFFVVPTATFQRLF